MERDTGDGEAIDHADLADACVDVDAEIEADDFEEARAFARLGVWAVPVALIHLFLLYTIVRVVTGFSLPHFLHTDLFIPWLWVNGAVVALAIWLWRKGRVPAVPGKWIGGRRAKRLILAWLALSLAWFVLPGLIGGVIQLLSPDLW